MLWRTYVRVIHRQQQQKMKFCVNTSVKWHKDIVAVSSNIRPQSLIWKKKLHLPLLIDDQFENDLTVLFCSDEGIPGGPCLSGMQQYSYFAAMKGVCISSP